MLRKLIGLWICAALTATSGMAQIEFERVAGNLNRPVFVTTAGDGSQRLFIVEQLGRIRIADSDGLNTSLFLDIRNEVLSGGESGLLGLAFHPQFASNRRFFVNYTRLLDGQAQTVIAEFLASANDPDRSEPVGRILLTYNQPFPNHNAGWIGFGPDGNLYIAAGDGGGSGDPNGNGQNVNTLLGSILRINVDSGDPYGIPPDNPFAAGGGRPEIWAYGFRNPFRGAFDQATGRLFVGDVGQRNWEEIDLVTRGGNYGWRTTEGPDCYPPGTLICDRTGLTDPIHAYGRDDGASVIGGVVFRGPANPNLSGRYIFGDFISGRIWSLTESQPGEWSRQLLADSGFSVSAFGEDAAGRLLVVDYQGTVWRVADQPGPDLALSMSALEPFVPGTLAGYRINVTNQGGLDAVGESLVITPLPVGVSFESAEGTGWSCVETPSDIRCTRADPITAGVTATLTLTVRISDPSPPQFVTTATVTHPEDSNSDNDSATVEVSALQPSRIPIHYPQVALGGVFRTLLLVSETSGSPWTGSVRLLQANDQSWDTPWSVNGEDRSGSPGFDVSIPARGAAHFLLEGDTQARDGYLEIVPDQGSSSLNLAANLFYESRDSSGTLFDSTATPSDFPGSLFVIPVQSGAGIETGFAISPLGAPDPFQIHLSLLDRDGVVVGEQNFTYQGHFADFVSEFFPDLEEGFAGSLRIEAEEGIFVAALRLETAAETFQLTSVPPARVR